MANTRISTALQSLMILQGLSLVVVTHGWYLNEADHYWPLSEIAYWRVYDYANFGDGKWYGNVKGEAEITWCSPQLALSLNGKDAWLDLETRYNTCYIDVHYCNLTGFTLAAWVNFREPNIEQGLFHFGGGDCGLTMTRTRSGEINCTMKSMELKKTWSLQSVNESLVTGVWHHLAFSWNFTTEMLYLYINGTRLENVSTEMSSNVTCLNTSNCTCDWSMKVGTQPSHNGSDQSYSSLELAKLVLWSKFVSNETVLEASNDMRGLFVSNRGCYGDWLAHLQFCYYIKPTWELTWNDAKETCERYGGNLVSIGSQEEYEALEQMLYNAQVPSCLHIGLHRNEANWTPSWIDGNLWSFSKLNASSLRDNSTNACAQRHQDGLWYMENCTRKCGFVCKKYRAGLFRNAEFQCRVRRHDYKLADHRIAIRLVENELACAIDCLIYGSGCQSYNYQLYNAVESAGHHICELNRSNQEKNPESLVPSMGYQYCERVA